MPRSRLLALIASLLALAVAAPAPAAFFRGDPIDGPSADLVSIGGVSLGRHGSGAVVYLKRDGGIAHAFAARNVTGVWQPPARLDGGMLLASATPVVAAGDLLTLAAFVNNGTLYVTALRPRDSTWETPVAIAAGAADPSVSVSVNGVGYVAWTAGGDVRAATMARTGTSWEAVSTPLDAVSSEDAGAPDIAASADGTALAAWVENGHVYARRVLHTALSAIVNQLDVPTLAGHGGGGADAPVVRIGDDSSFAWVGFRELFDGGATSHVLVRQLIGSAFDPPVDLGAGFAGEGAAAPAVAMAGRGYAAFASDSATSHTPWGALYYPDVANPPFALGGARGVPSQPQVAIGESSQTTFAWLQAAAPSGAVVVQARGYKRNVQSDPVTTISDPALGSVDTSAGFFAAADKAGDTVIPYIQGTDAGRRLVAAGWDHPPGYIAQRTTHRWRRALPVSWRGVSDLWGPITYTVYVDTRPIGSTSSLSFPIAGAVSDGRHRWRVVATDAHGQRRSSHSSLMAIDSHAPSLRVSVPRSARAGVAVAMRARAADHGSGLVSVRFDFGDGARASGTRVAHAFRRPGTRVVTVTALDAAGNIRTVTRTVHVR